MVRKRRTKAPSGAESSETHETGGTSRGPQHHGGRSAPPPQKATGGGGSQGGRGWGPHGGRGGYGGGRGRGIPQQQATGGGGSQGGRGWGPQGGRGGYGGGRGRGIPQQQYDAPPEYRGRGRGGYSQQLGCGRVGGGNGSGRGSRPSFGGPSRPQAPELHQTTPLPHHAGVTPTSEASSSSQQFDLSQVEQQMGQMSIHSESVSPAPPSSKSVRLPLRPGKGSYGTNCVVKANHFFARLPNKDLHQYDVTITPEVTSRGVNRAVVEQLVRLYRESHLGRRLPAYDGRKGLYFAGPLPFIL
ncbi:hypothetical protein QN277_010937 [Acacia crassicarpa]|uniref:Uncharacterized protein n=1 Tax=Acacia crassicarpa TaxID=499986 RepID=A0AAE1MB36_9FABA|nr:hypothetical protein QN277_010937 [Acacia crassicarpa]